MVHPVDQAGSGAPRRDDAGHQRFRLCVASDLHIMAEPQGKLRGADVRDNASRVFAHLGSLATASKPDLLLLNGDISHDGSAGSYSYVTSRLDTIPLPYLVTPGNHDTSGPFSADFASLPKTVKLGQSYALRACDLESG
jgi:3',5'-cyclic-AMP phosphodiesterase